jgi:hypothetical protein
MSNIALQHQYKIVDTDIVHVNSIFESNKDSFIKYENFETASKKYFVCDTLLDLHYAFNDSTYKHKYILTTLSEIQEKTTLLF